MQLANNFQKCHSITLKQDAPAFTLSHNTTVDGSFRKKSDFKRYICSKDHTIPWLARVLLVFD